MFLVWTIHSKESSANTEQTLLAEMNSSVTTWYFAVNKNESLTFSSSFFTVLRLALKSTDSLTLAPSRAPSMASADTLTLLRAGLFILPFSSKIFWDRSCIFFQHKWQQMLAAYRMHSLKFLGHLILPENHVTQTGFQKCNLPPFHFSSL